MSRLRKHALGAGAVALALLLPGAGAAGGAAAGAAGATGLAAIGHQARSAGVITTTWCEQQYQVPCYDPAQVQQAYSLAALYSRNVTGAGATIAIIVPYGSPTIRADLGTFDAAFGLPNPKLKVMTFGSVPRFNQHNSDMVGAAWEASNDVEWAHAMAPGASILLVETPTEGDGANLYMARATAYVAAHHLADVVSMSLGSAEQAMGGAGEVSAFHSYYAQAVADHVTVLAAAGDQGASADDGNTYYSYRVAEYPASDPDVTAVGGTELNLNASGGHASPDTVWNDTYNTSVTKVWFHSSKPVPSAGGGGRSVIFSRPSYQASVWRTVGDSRGIPDISMDAACSSSVEVYAAFPGVAPGWSTFCGTSVATPLFAGIVALADQVARRPLGLINPAIYKLAAEHAPGIIEVTSGNNTVSFANGGSTHAVHGYTARDGYSRVAGVGTIDGQYFVPELAHLG